MVDGQVDNFDGTFDEAKNDGFAAECVDVVAHDVADLHIEIVGYEEGICIYDAWSNN